MFYLENKYNVPEPFTGGLLAMGFFLLVRKDRT
jgi:Na+/glutamate symporter